MIEQQPGTDWRDLQGRVAAILKECGLEAETPKKLKTVRGEVEFDVWARNRATSPPTVYVCECKRWNSSVPQNEVHAFRTTVSDVGAHQGLFISAMGFQSGAGSAAEFTNVTLLNWQEFQEVFTEQWATNYFLPFFRHRGDRLAGRVEPWASDAAIAVRDGSRQVEAWEAVGLMALSTWSSLIFPNGSSVDRVWGMRDMYRKFLPPPASTTIYLRELLDTLLQIIQSWEDANPRSPGGGH